MTEQGNADWYNVATSVQQVRVNLDSLWGYLVFRNPFDLPHVKRWWCQPLYTMTNVFSDTFHKYNLHCRSQCHRCCTVKYYNTRPTVQSTQELSFSSVGNLYYHLSLNGKTKFFWLARSLTWLPPINNVIFPPCPTSCKSMFSAKISLDWP